MTTITKERLLTIKQWRETYGPGSNVVLPAEEAEELARIALASLEAEPVAKIIAHYPLGIDVGKQKFVQAIGELPDFGGYLFAAPPAPIALEAIENAIEYIRSIAFHIDEDDYHGKHIAYFMRQALAWLEGYSCSDDRLGKAENQTVHGNQAAESNRGNEWTGNPDIDNAIIMLDRIDTLENCDDDRIEAVKAVLRRLAGNSPVTPDGWISCSERMPDTKTAVLVAVEFDRKGDWRMKWATYIPGHPDANDGWIIPGASWKPSHWMPLPEPPQEAK
ncbi:TPA: DUF551 domain-containing protein [Escherichia coli]|nr:DUF551 domain-containing protein [Escherichia coli]EES3604066.1 DUF551 domain-containing protein [Escherichia coli]MCJ1107023.1 DUF551 domain-containing protein [Escherichia coli]MCT6046311.1 DUF551 domain-containing protein [Escherichia coli]BDW03664.1 hypothetical protein M10153_p1_083 [Escherichia coli]HDV3398771.1 DUF551 domain-containing protein [Escherichia coli]